MTGPFSYRREIFHISKFPYSSRNDLPLFLAIFVFGMSFKLAFCQIYDPSTTANISLYTLH